MKKDPQFDLRYQYRRVIEVSAVISLSLVTVMFIVSKKFDTKPLPKELTAVAIQVEDVPITRTIKKTEAPRKPTIPIADPDIDIAQDLDMPDLMGFDDLVLDAAPPPPPPPGGEETVPFFKVEVKPTLVGGNQAIADFIVKNNLFPKMAREAGVSGRAIISFTVGPDGKTRDVKVKQERPEGLGFGEAGVKVMQAMTFKPGMQRDRAVSVPMEQPISFTID